MPRNWWFAVVAVVALISPLAGAADPPAPPQNPFNLQDPEIQALKKLDWKGIDYAALPTQTRCEALLALTKLLDMAGGKADARADLLSAYLTQYKLGPEYAADATEMKEPPTLTYDDAKKVAAAFVKTPTGKAKFGNELPGASEALLRNYIALYDKTCTRKWHEVIESRAYVSSMAQFLQRKGKWDDYLKWSVIEAARQQQQYDAQLKERQASYVQAEEEKQAKAYTDAQRREAAQREAQAAQQLQYAMSAQSSEGAGNGNNGGGNNNNNGNDGNDGNYSNGSSDGGYEPGWYGGDDAFYVNSAYRAAARDRYQGRVNNWRAPGRR